MAFSRRRRRVEGAARPEIAAGPRLEGRHFFKIILSDTLESGKLGIPKSFLRRCGKDLSNSVLLQVPGGSTWTIGLEKCHNDTVSLWKGWREFTEYYSIGYGHVIVFEYKGNSTFCVIIFNKSASEIDYSLSSSETSYLGSKFPSPKTEDIVEAEDLAPRRRMRVGPHLPYSQPSPIYSPRGSEACIHTVPKEPELSQAQADSTERIQQSTCRVSPSELVFHGPTLPRPLTPPELACKSDLEPPFFKTVILRSYMTCLVFRQIVAVKLLSYTETRRTKKHPSHRVFFTTGWPAFARETVCVAACIGTIPEEPDLSQALADSTDRVQQSTCRGSRSELVFHGPTLPRPLTPLELACKFHSEHPFFKTVITRSYLCCLSIPAGFIKQHIQENKGIATLRFSGKSWPVFFSTGWLAFARETRMHVGNICVFELIDRDDVMFQVSIFRRVGRRELSTCRAGRSELDFHGATLPRSLTSLELASNFDTEHPFFKLVMPQSCMSYLRVPVGFAHQHIQENKQIATLLYSDRLWPVKLTRSPARAGGRLYLSFSAGWRAFARETNLHAGDVCVFELIDRDDTVLKVSILSGGG
ncbi:uncharacterized protein J3R85_008105 [Psidium guajava]|nr:uncharacterized protein J3R85_008105 [Psidium guajava]